MNFFNIVGFGTVLYGSRDKNPQDKSYTTTGWLILLYLPIIPLGSYRVTIGNQYGFGVGATVNYEKMEKIPLNTRQVINTYALWYISLLVIIGVPTIFFWWLGNTPVDQLPASLRPQY